MIDVSELSDAWVAAVWRSSWQGGVAVLVAWSVCRLVPSMPARFQVWLWRLVVLKFAVAFVWSAPIGVPLLPASAPMAAESSALLTPDRAGVGIDPVTRDTSPVSVSLWVVVFLAWSAAVGWQVVRLLGACLAARRLRRGCRPTGRAELLHQAAAIGDTFGYGKPPTVLETDGDGSPMLVGILRPAIVFPAATLARLGESERAIVIGHELAHARRGDLIWGLLAAVVRAAFFFHPLAWLTERRLRAVQEVGADELAVACLNHAPAGYAALLVSVVGKFGPGRALPAMSVGVAGSHQSLKQRIYAMRFMKPMSRRAAAMYGVSLGLVAVLGLVPWAVVAAQPTAANKVEPKKTVDQKEKNGSGRFVSFEDGTLTLESNAGELLVWNKMAESKNTVKFDSDANEYKRVDGTTAAALAQLKAGTYVMVGDKSAYVRIGARKDKVVGTFISFKAGRLLLLGTNLPESFTKRYGNTLPYNRFRDDVAVHESIDGGEYKLIGTANKVLGNVKEGTVLTVHGEGDDNITLIQIGVLKKN